MIEMDLRQDIFCYEYLRIIILCICYWTLHLLLLFRIRTVLKSGLSIISNSPVSKQLVVILPAAMELKCSRIGCNFVSTVYAKPILQVPILFQALLNENRSYGRCLDNFFRD